MHPFFPILVQIAIALGIAVGVLVVSHLFGQRSRTSKIKDTAYECGMLPQGEGGVRFSIKWYVVALLFVIFDIEVVYLFPWVIVYREFIAAGITIFFPVMFFLAVLCLGLLYEYKRGALDWEK